jgi:hypothetical protein
MKIKQTLLICISIFILGCSAQSRLNRLEKKHPELFKVDTLWKYDTVKIESTIFDTILQAGATGDTIVIHDSLMTIRYFSDGKKVYIQGETKTIERIVKYPVQVKAAVIRETTNKIAWWIYLIGGLMALTILLLAIKK